MISVGGTELHRGVFWANEFSSPKVSEEVFTDVDGVVAIQRGPLTGGRLVILEAEGSDKGSRGKRSSVPHWILPALTALTISLPLSQLPQSPIWWIGFALGGVLLILVLIAEYIVVDPQDLRYQPAAAGLTAVSFALFLILATALSFSDMRLFLLFPAISVAGGLVCLRTLNLRLEGRWAYTYAGITALLTGQLAAALHYWPLSPVAFGLALLGPAYALTNFWGNLDEGEPLRQALIEPFVILILVLLMAVWLG